MLWKLINCHSDKIMSSLSYLLLISNILSSIDWWHKRMEISGIIFFCFIEAIHKSWYRSLGLVTLFCSSFLILLFARMLVVAETYIGVLKPAKQLVLVTFASYLSCRCRNRMCCAWITTMCEVNYVISCVFKRVQSLCAKLQWPSEWAKVNIPPDM